jgi:unsaturated rhamnogalacturonyl hydrolase
MADIEKVKRALLCMQRHSWEQGMAAQAFLELGDIDTVILLAKEAASRQAADGRLAVVGVNDSVVDPAANGEPLLVAAQATGDPLLKGAADRMVHYLICDAPRAADGTIYHLTSRLELWVDSMYMAPPFLAVAGYPDEAVRQVEGYRAALWDDEKKLFSHRWDEKRCEFVRRDFWGVGNGWAAAGMTRILRVLPPTMGAERRRLSGYTREVIDGCLAHRRPDGLFHDVVDNPQTFVETNLAQMLAYSIYRGVKGGWLDGAYLWHAESLRQAAHAKVDTYGLVQGVCGAPQFDHAGVAPEGQAFFLLMEAAASDFAAGAIA